MSIIVLPPLFFLSGTSLFFMRYFIIEQTNSYHQLVNMSISFKMNSKNYYSLNPDEVHISSACLSENEASIPYFSALLSQDEQERASGFRFVRDQKRYTISRGILRSLLARYLGEAPQKIEILYGLWGGFVRQSTNIPLIRRNYPTLTQMHLPNEFHLI